MTTIDPTVVLSSLGVGDAEMVRPITTGLGGTSLFRVERPSGDLALRVYAPGAWAPVARELAAMAVAAAGGVPVPAIQARGEWDVRPVVLLEWRPGRTIFDELRRRPWRVLAIGQAMGRAQALIHTAPVSDELRRLKRDWVTRFGPPSADLEVRLRQIGGEDRLIHLDFHPQNVMMADGEVSGVIDWENATLGDVRADLARTWSILRYAPAPPSPVNLVAGPLRRALEVGWRRGYREVAGRAVGMAPFLAWAVEAMVRDLEPNVGRPGVWFGEAEIAAIRREADRLRERAGLG